MRAVIIGGAGFIGSHLAVKLANTGWQVEVLSRSPEKARRIFSHPNIKCTSWDGQSLDNLTPIVDGSQVVVNLAGAGVADSQWTPERKREILESRLVPTTLLVKAIERCTTRPNVVVQGSAIGYYGYEAGDDDPVDEFEEVGKGFLAEVCSQWEAAALPLAKLIGRLVVVRTGVVLGKQGFLEKLRLIFSLGLGGKVGTGQQPLPWIHLEDEVGAICHLISCEHASGIYNLVAPQLATYTDFVRAYGAALNRPAFLPTPTFALKMLMGAELVNEVLLGGREVVSSRLSSVGYQFIYKDLGDALSQIEHG